MPLASTTVDKVERLAAAMLPGHALRRAARTDLAITDDGYARAERLRGSVPAPQVDVVPTSQIATDGPTSVSSAADLETRLQDLSDIIVDITVVESDTPSIDITVTPTIAGTEVSADIIYAGSGGAFGTAATPARSDHTHASGGISDFTEAAQDAVGASLLDTSSIDLTYNDGSNQISAAAIFGTSAGTVAEGNHTHASGGITDFAEAAQDAVGGMIADTSSINLTYTDATPELKAEAIFGTSAGTVAEGNHAHSGVYVPVSHLVDHAIVLPPMVAGNRYSTQSSWGGTGSVLAMTAGVLYAAPIVFWETQTVTLVEINVTVAAAGGKFLKLLLYSSLSTGLPDAPLVDSGNLAADTAAPFTASFACSQALTAGVIYWLVAWSDGAPTIRSVLANGGQAIFGATAANDTGRRGVQRTLAYGAAPNPFGTITGYSNNVPYVCTSF